MKQSIVIAGDILPWNQNISKFENGETNALFSNEVCSLFRDAELSVVNLEGPLTSSSKKQHKIGPVIKGTPGTVHGLGNLGVKLVALANNHITDYLNQGIVDTVYYLNKTGIQAVGYGKEGEVFTHKTFMVASHKVCIYNVSETFFNVPTLDNIGVNLYDEYVVCTEIKELKKSCDFLIVIYHGGAEYMQYPSPQTRKRFHRMADCGADFITSQHTHCIGCEEFYNGSYLLYGQGNFCFAKQADGNLMCRQGLVCELTFNGGKLVVTNHCVEMNTDGCLVYKGTEFIPALKQRSAKIDDVKMIETEFSALKPFNIVERYLAADKGKLLFTKRIKKRFFPNVYKKELLNSYSIADIERHYFVLSSDRAREDVYYMWRGIQNEEIK